MNKLSRLTNKILSKCNNDVDFAMKVASTKAVIGSSKVEKAIFTHSFQELEVKKANKGFSK